MLQFLRRSGFDYKNPANIKKIIVFGIVLVVFGAATVVYFSDTKAAMDEPIVLTSEEGTASGIEVGNSSSSGPRTEPDPENDKNAQGSTASQNEPGKIYVDVGGSVAAPGVVIIPEGSRVFEAINAAGGLSDDADTRYLNRAAMLSDGDHIYVPTAAEIADGSFRVTDTGAVTGSNGTGGSGSSLINLNTADAAGLQQLNGVGPSTAQKIIDYRNAHGGFTKIEDIKKVSGIGEITYEKLKEHITV